MTSTLGLIGLVSYLSRNIKDNPLPYAIKILSTYNRFVKSLVSSTLTPY
ncbi:hypothetical protein SJAV_10850 [Sulfurisphaera javensis]|uniref:Uncharacterized protein n=1 Tax=Sulfurisphaera javensis TaxID=2049879 RepID=A0AAT9GQF0_9CREN